MGSKWPDKHDKPGFVNVARGGGNFFRVAIPPLRPSDVYMRR